jgi:cell division control protein 6
MLGGGGFGKTLTARYFGRNLKNIALEHNAHLDDFFIEYFNCLTFDSVAKIFREILGKLTFGNGHGFSNVEMIKQTLAALKRRNQYLFIILDEVHCLSEDDLILILNLQETFNQDNTRLSMLLLSRNSQWYKIETEKILSRLTEKIDLPFYTNDQVYTILNERVKAAFKEDVMTKRALETLTKIVIEKKNLRHGIDILRKAGEFADKNEIKTITPEIISKFKDQAYSQFYEKLQFLNTQQQVALLALLKTFKNSKDNEATINTSFEEYERYCERFNITSHVKMSFRKYCRELEETQFLIQKTRGFETRRGRYSVYFPYHPEVDEFIETLEHLFENKFKYQKGE